jgi:hypothetical protein
MTKRRTAEHVRGKLKGRMCVERRIRRQRK